VCRRYQLSGRKQIIEEHFDTAPWEEDWSPRYNIAPTQPVAVIRPWGLIPHWARTPSIATSTINARSETAAAKPAFRDPLKFRRCLIPADGFYEWAKTANGKQPYCFEVNDGELFAFAGLWDGWKDSNEQLIKTCSILTTTPNSVTATVHDRMPVILDPDSYGLWLDPGMQNVAAISDICWQRYLRARCSHGMA
jgi:putative SOS response-associated peptidase YedK